MKMKSGLHVRYALYVALRPSWTHDDASYGFERTCARRRTVCARCSFRLELYAE